MKFSGIILAGGESTRFNNNKINIKIDTVPLFIHQIFKLSFFCDEILVVSNLKNQMIIEKELEKIDEYFNLFFSRENILIPQTRIILDKAEFKDKISKSIGPIAGISTGLIEAKNSYSIIQAFDMPFTSFNLYKLLIEKNKKDLADIVIVKTQKGLEALCAIYSKRCADFLLYNINKKIFKITEVLPYLNVSYIDEEILKENKIDKLNFFNINKDVDNVIMENIWSGLQCDKLLNVNNIYFNNNYSKVIVSNRWAGFFYRGLNKVVLVN